MAENIDNVTIFAKMPAPMRAALAAAMVDLSLPAGRVLFREDDLAGGNEGLYVLREGSLTVSVKRPLGGFSVLRTIEAGEVVGVLGLVNPDAHRTATVVAGSDCRVSHLSRPAVLALTHGDPRMACAFQLVLAEQLVYDLRRVDEALRAAVTRADSGEPVHQVRPG